MCEKCNQNNNSMKIMKLSDMQRMSIEQIVDLYIQGYSVEGVEQMNSAPEMIPMDIPPYRRVPRRRTKA